MPYPEHNQWWSEPFWEQSMDRWDGMFTAGLRSQLATCLFGLPLWRESGYGSTLLASQAVLPSARVQRGPDGVRAAVRQGPDQGPGLGLLQVPASGLLGSKGIAAYRDVTVNMYYLWPP